MDELLQDWIEEVLGEINAIAQENCQPLNEAAAEWWEVYRGRVERKEITPPIVPIERFVKPPLERAVATVRLYGRVERLGQAKTLRRRLAEHGDAEVLVMEFRRRELERLCEVLEAPA